MGNRLRAKVFVQCSERVLFLCGHGSPPGALSELDGALKVAGFGIHEEFAEGRSTLHDRLTERSQPFVAVWFVRSVLGGELPDLFEGIHERQRALTDKVQLLPELVQFGFV